MLAEDPAFRLLITVSRNYTLVAVINTTLAGIWWEWGCPANPILVSGHCPTGDAICERCWRARGFEVEEHPARWEEHDIDCPAWCLQRRTCLAAGYRRDEEMVNLGATVCAAFIAPCVKRTCRNPKPHGSHGATRTAFLAREAGIDTRPTWHPDLPVSARTLAVSARR